MREALISLIILSFLLFSSDVYANVVINEVLINAEIEPDGEWIELYNNGNISINLSNWKIGDNEVNFTIQDVILNSTEFLLLVYNQTLINVTGIKVIEYGSKVPNLKLANTNDTIFIFDDLDHLIDRYSWNNSKKNISQGRYPDGFEWRDKLIPTPGTNNKPFPKIQLSVNLPDNIAVGILYTSLFKIKIDKNNCSLKDLVTIKYNITSSDGNLVKEDIFTREVGCSAYTNTGEWIPNETGNFLVCGEVINSTVNETNVDVFACKNVSVLETISILFQPTIAKFGDFKFISLKLNTSVYEYNKIRFLVYGKSKRVVSDLSWNKITKYADCFGDLMVEANLTKNQTYFFSIPFLIYPNCDSSYSDGNYEIALRICKPIGTDWEKYVEHVFTLSIAGKNEKLCPQPEIKTVFKILETNITKTNATKQEESYRIIFSPTRVRAGEEFNVTILLRNLGEETKNFSVYSYVFEGNKLLSEGLDENGKWKRTWSANERQIVLQAKEEKLLTLTSRIKMDVEQGEYNLRIRIKGEKDITIPIEILKPINAKLSCNVLENVFVVTVTNFGDEANFSLIAKTHNKTEEFFLGEREKKEFNFTLLKQNNFLLVFNNKILDSCFFVKESQIIKKIEEKKVRKGISGMFIRGTNYITSLFYKILEFVRKLI